MKLSSVIISTCCFILITAPQINAQKNPVKDSQTLITGNTPELNIKLNDAVKASDYKQIDALLKSRADINSMINCETPLMYAIRTGDMKMIKYLIGKGADVNKKIEIGNRTPLYNAIMYGKADAVKILLSKKSDPNALVEENRSYTDNTNRMEKNISMVFTAVQAHYSTPQILDMLLKKGGKPDFTTSEGHRAITEAIYSRKVEHVKLLVKAGTDLQYKEKLPKPQQWRTDKDLTVIEYAYEIKKMCDRPDNLKKSEEIIAIIEAKLKR